MEQRYAKLPLLGNVREADPSWSAGTSAGAPAVVNVTSWGIDANAQFTVPPACTSTVAARNSIPGATTPAYAGATRAVTVVVAVLVTAPAVSDAVIRVVPAPNAVIVPASLTAAIAALSL